MLDAAASRRSAPSSPRAARRAPPRTAPATRSPPPSGSTTSASMPMRSAGHGPAPRRGRAVQAVGERPHAARALPRRPSRTCSRRSRRSPRSGRPSPTSRCASSPAAPPSSGSASPRKGFSWSTVGTDALTVPRTRGDDELRLARAGHRHPRVPARRAPRVRPCPGHDPRAPEPRRRRQDPVGRAEGLRLLRPAGLVPGGRRLQHLRRLRRRHDELHDVRPDLDHAVRRSPTR